MLYCQEESRLKKFAEKFGRQWGAEVQWATADWQDMPRAVLDEICLMIHEGLVNGARHTNATTATVALAGARRRIVAAPDGGGFPSGVSQTVVEIRIPIKPGRA